MFSHATLLATLYNMISVIIPTRNRADFLAAALESLTRQTLSRDMFEVLVIDNGSTDLTSKVAQEYSGVLGNIRYFFDSEPGLHIGRHRGMLESKNDILVFADDDIEALPTWLEAIKDAFLNPDVAMVGGNNFPQFLQDPPRWLKQMWERTQKDGSHSISALSIFSQDGPARTFSPYYVWGCNFSIRKSVLYAAGGFHPDGMPRDLLRFRGDGETHVSQYVMETGLQCIFHPGASVFHKVPPERMTLDYFFQRGFNQGISDSYTALRNPVKKSVVKRGSLLQRMVRRCMRTMGALRIYKSGSRLALSEMKRGHSKGFAFHQKAYQEDAEVKSWVHKVKYFEEGNHG